tara:strand:+ start:273 stop:893 length:621 start_codon:yes stop_codon:yes gene_type:complete
MARRKNTKRIDPRYFLNETTYRDLDEQDMQRTRQGPLLPHLMAKDYAADQDARPIEAIDGYMLGNLDLAEMVRDWHFEVSNEMAGEGPSGQSVYDIMVKYMEKNPERAKAFEYLKSVVELYDNIMAQQMKVIQNRGDVGAFNAEVEKKYSSELQRAQKELPKLFKRTKGTDMRKAQARTLSKRWNTGGRYQRQRAQAQAQSDKSEY